MIPRESSLEDSCLISTAAGRRTTPGCRRCSDEIGGSEGSAAANGSTGTQGSAAAWCECEGDGEGICCGEEKRGGGGGG